MNRTILLGLAGAALAVALAAGALYADPALLHLGVSPAQAAAPTAQPVAPQTSSAARPAGKLLAALLVRATAMETTTPAKDVRAALKAGQSLAQYAQAHGNKSVSDVVVVARATLGKQLDRAVKRGRLTAAQRDAQLQAFDANATQAMNDAALGQQLRRVRLSGALVGGLVKATAAVSGTQAKDVRAALKGGQSLAQYAQAHGKTADDILAKLREQGQQQLDNALDRAKDLINKPNLGRG